MLSVSPKFKEFLSDFKDHFWILISSIKMDCLQEEFQDMEELPHKVFLRGFSPYLCEFQCNPEEALKPCDL